MTGKDCLAIFPRNFEKGDSYLQIDDELPSSKVPKNLDGKNWRLSELAIEEITTDGGI
jgi:hypothetical protein